MVQRVTTVAFEGIEARAVDVQVQVAPGLPAFNILWLNYVYVIVCEMDTSPKRPKAYSYIRMSTEAQLKGFSRKRQLEKSKQYAAEKNLELVEDFNLEDIGVSAFRGANVSDGALGQFLAAAESGKVERGSFLLVESLDRISRQEIKKSLQLMLRIMEAGINIVTVLDGHVYSAEKTDLTDLVMSLMILSRGNEESQIKHERVSDAWARKRARRPRSTAHSDIGHTTCHRRRQRYHLTERSRHISFGHTGSDMY